MAAPEGNEFWRLAEHTGRPRKYDPPGLLAVAYEYFTWSTQNPWQKKEAVKGGDNAGMIISIPTARPFTIQGLCIFAGISVQTFDTYGKNQDFLEVVTRIREIIYNQKFEGAAVGAFNANIIARDLGLADKKEVNKVVKKLDFKDAL